VQALGFTFETHVGHAVVLVDLVLGHVAVALVALDECVDAVRVELLQGVVGLAAQALVVRYLFVHGFVAALQVVRHTVDRYYFVVFVCVFGFRLDGLGVRVVEHFADGLHGQVLGFVLVCYQLHGDTFGRLHTRRSAAGPTVPAVLLLLHFVLCHFLLGVGILLVEGGQSGHADEGVYVFAGFSPSHALVLFVSLFPAFFQTGKLGFVHQSHGYFVEM